MNANQLMKLLTDGESDELVLYLNQIESNSSLREILLLSVENLIRNHAHTPSKSFPVIKFLLSKAVENGYFELFKDLMSRIKKYENELFYRGFSFYQMFVEDFGDFAEQIIIKNRPEMLEPIKGEFTYKSEVLPLFRKATEKNNLIMIKKLCEIFPWAQFQSINDITAFMEFFTIIDNSIIENRFDIADCLIQYVCNNNSAAYSNFITHAFDLLKEVSNGSSLNDASRYLLNFPEIFLKAREALTDECSNLCIEFINEKMTEFSNKPETDLTDTTLYVAILQNLYPANHREHEQTICSLIRLPAVRKSFFSPKEYVNFSDSSIDVSQDMKTNDSNQIIYRLFFSPHTEENTRNLLNTWVENLIVRNPLRIDLLNIALDQAIKCEHWESFNRIITALKPLPSSRLSEINWKEKLCEVVRVNSIPMFNTLLSMSTLKNNTEAYNAAFIEACQCVRPTMVKCLLQAKNIIFSVVQPYVNDNVAIATMIDKAKDRDFSDDEFLIIEQLLENSTVTEKLRLCQLRKILSGVIQKNRFDLFKQLVPLFEKKLAWQDFTLLKELFSEVVQKSDNIEMVNYLLKWQRYFFTSYVYVAAPEPEDLVLAAERGCLDIVERLLQYPSVCNHLSVNSALTAAAKKGGSKGHRDVVVRLLNQVSLMNAGATPNGRRANDPLCVALSSFDSGEFNDNIRFLLSYSKVFNYAVDVRNVSQHGQQVKLFVKEKLIEFERRVATSNPLSDAEALTYCSYFCYIENNYLTLRNYYQDELHIFPQLSEALTRNQGANRLLRARRRLEVLDRPASTFQTDLQRVANDPESAMRHLNSDDTKRLKRVTERYLPKINEKGGMDNAFEEMRRKFKECYESNPAVFCNRRGNNISLPCDWEAFQALSLSKKNYNAALKAYYAHPLHTAIRYLSDQNPWMYPDANYVISSNDVRYKRADLGDGSYSYKPMIVVLWFMMSDPTVPLTDGHTLDTRIDFFISKLAEAGRTHNWDKKRDKKDNNGRKVIKDGEVVREHFDDGEGDRPSCYSGARGYIFSATQQGQQLFRPLTIEYINAEMREFIHEHFQSIITDSNKETLQTAWNTCVQNVDITDAIKETLLVFNLPSEKQQAFEQKLSENYGDDLTESLKEHIKLCFAANDECHAITFGESLAKLLPQPPDPDVGFREIFEKLRQHEYELWGGGITVGNKTFSDGAARIYNCVQPLFDPNNDEAQRGQIRNNIGNNIKNILTEKTEANFLFFRGNLLRKDTTKALYNEIKDIIDNNGPVP